MFDGLNDSVLSAFGEPFTFKGQSADVVLTGVFDERIDREAVGGIGLSDRVFTLSLRQSDVETAGITLRDTVQVRGLDYQVLDIHTDVAGMTSLILRAYG
ncbi:MAG: head-tail joining protein [Gammaproteobacteria bacterium]